MKIMGDNMDKEFLTYNQQMKYLRDKKNIDCSGTDDKIILCRAGYFNLVNGYKQPFVNGKDSLGNHKYLPNTSIKNLDAVKSFDDDLRIILLKYITKAEEEIRTFAAYKFDEVNKQDNNQWYQVTAFNSNCDVKKIIAFISKAYGEISRSKQDYIKFYMDNHKVIPTWVLIKVINFSTFIDFVDYNKDDVKKSLCKLYSLIDNRGYDDFNLLVGSLHWMRHVRNACAHNERVYSIKRDRGRIYCSYFSLLSRSYTRESEQKLIDLLIYLKYFLETNDYNNLIGTVKNMLVNLQGRISSIAFNNIRASMGIKDISHLDKLLLSNKIIQYNKF